MKKNFISCALQSNKYGMHFLSTIPLYIYIYLHFLHTVMHIYAVLCAIKPSCDAAECKYDLENF